MNVWNYIDTRTRRVFLAAFSTSLLLMGTGMFIGTLGIDDEGVILATEYGAIGRGQWALTALVYLLPGQAGITFAPMLFGCAIYAASITVLVRVWALRDAYVECMAAAVIGCFPYFASMMTFDTAQIAYPISLLLATISAAIAFHPSPRVRLVWGSMAFAVAFGLYQGAAATFATVLVSSVGMRLAIAGCSSQQFRASMTRFGLQALCIAALGSALYLLIDQLVKATVPHKPWPAHYAVRIDLLFLNPERLGSAVRQARVLLSGATGDLPWLSAALFLIVGAIAFARVVVTSTLSLYLRWTLALGLLAASLVAPFAILLVQAHPLAPRSTVGIGVLYGFAYALIAYRSGKWLRYLANAVAGVWCFQFVMLGNEMYYCQHLATIADMATTNRLVARIDQVAAQHRLASPVTVTFVGRFAPGNGQHARFDTLGSSAFDWDQGNIYRQRNILKVLGVDGVKIEVDPEVRARVAEHVVNGHTPAWPAPGSVFLYEGDLIAVNLGRLRP